MSPGYAPTGNLRLFAPDSLWIPITIGAAAAQTARNAAQRHLTPILGTLGATLVRFLCSGDCRYMTGAMLHANGAAYVTIG